MKVFDKEYGLLYSVGAMAELKEQCQDKDLKNLKQLLDTPESGKQLLCIMSRWHEKAEAMQAQQAIAREHAATIELLEAKLEMTERIVEEKGFMNYSWVQTGCVIAAHSGPGAFGIVGFAK